MTTGHPTHSTDLTGRTAVVTGTMDGLAVGHQGAHAGQLAVPQ